MSRNLAVATAGAILAGVTAFNVAFTVVSHSSPIPNCPPNTRCMRDPIDFIDTSKTALNQIVFSDPSNAPQFSVGVGGAVSWANPLCISNNPLTHPPLRYVACIGGKWGNGQGYPLLTLYDNKGNAISLTIRDLRALHTLERTIPWLKKK